jgi:hypothetical protein
VRRALACFALAASLCAPVHGEVPAWLAAGERLTYELSYLRVVGGALTMEAGQVAGQPAIRLASRAVSSPFVSRFAKVDEQLESILDPMLATTLVSRRHRLDEDAWREEIVLIDPARGVARRWKDGREQDPLAVPTPVLDTLGSVFWLRTLPLEPDREFRLTVQSGSRVYPLAISVSGPSHLRTATGTQQTLIVVPRFREGGMLRQKGKLTLWVTLDATHTPLRIRSELSFGSLTATLTRIERPWSPMIQLSSGSERYGRESHGP